MVYQITAPRGVPEYLPPIGDFFKNLTEKFLDLTQSYGFSYIELPVFEESVLYTRGVGESTDIVSKEMYTFTDKSNRSLTLRPEATAGVMRSVIQHGLINTEILPLKFSYAGPFFRYERPQKGRYRQLTQLGVEVIGVDDPYLDAEIICLAHNFFQKIGLQNIILELSSLGDSASKQKYREVLKLYLEKQDLDLDTQQRIQLNPLRVLDDKRDFMQPIIAAAPKLINYLSPAAITHFQAVQRLLDENKVAYQLNPNLVRGLDYYTKTVFEFSAKDLGAQSGVGGGGRYDNLMKELGGKSDMSGVGFGLGLDRILIALKTVNENILTKKIDVYGGCLTETSKSVLFKILEALRQQGWKCEANYIPSSIKNCLKIASRSAAKYAIIAGFNGDPNKILVKELKIGIQKEFTAAEIILGFTKVNTEKEKN